MKYDAVIIGGGLVGLATALKLSEKNPKLKLAVLEKEPAVGMHQSGNNSGVIHSGIYYKPGSLKAENCAKGRRQLLDFCGQNNIKYEICGKIIVAVDREETARLNLLFERGVLNGLTGIKKINSKEIEEYEPSARGVAGIFVPQTGIVDYSSVVKAYAENFKTAGGEIFFNEKVAAITRKNGESNVITQNKVYNARLVINCAGLYSDKIALLNRPKLNVRIIPFRGEYFKLKLERRGLIKNLIYPVPDPNLPFLGVHFTRRINGEIEAGPNAVFAFKREGYKFSNFNFKEFIHSIFWPGFGKMSVKNWRAGAEEFYRSLSKKAFLQALQKLVPEITENDIEPGGAGVRAQAVDKQGNLIDDFLILEDAFQIDIINAPSPAATASLAIGEKIANMVLGRF